MESIDANLLALRAPALAFYSPYNFLRNLAYDRQQNLFGAGRFTQFPADQHEKVATLGTNLSRTQLLLSELPWDTGFFETRTLKLLTGLFDPDEPLSDRVAVIKEWQNNLAAQEAYYCFSEIPTEDTALLQTLTACGWRLVETRLVFYRDDLANFDQPRYAVRVAQPNEAERVGRIAAKARNVYDRFHADAWFGEAKADAFLARYASEAVQGYCDAVLVPDEPGLPVDSFLAISDLRTDAATLGVGLSRVVLTAVGPQNQGWHLRLTSETVHRARMNGASYVLMTTQATNRAVFRTCEKLGFKLGGSSHIVACHS